MKRKPAIHDLDDFEIGSLYQLQKPARRTTTDYNFMRFFDQAGKGHDIQFGDIVMCLSKGVETSFLLPNGLVACLHVSSFIANQYFGINLIKVTTKKEANHA